VSKTIWPPTAATGDEWLPTPLATQALCYSAKTLKRYRDIDGGFLVAGRHWAFGPTGASAISWNITQCRMEFHRRGLMRLEAEAALKELQEVR
jgi:hypothetical protein